ncbi:basic secretory family protein, partial [bacterium]|nr:basic secretory family protein [bacterium]
MDCEESSIKSSKDLQKLFLWAQTWFVRNFKFSFPELITILAVYPTDINPKINVLKQQRALGLCQSKYRIQGSKKTIESISVKIEIAMPKFQTKNVLVHELTHCWQQLSFPDFEKMSIEFIEGHAEYIAWLHDKSFGLEAMVKAKLEDKSYPYGSGFHKMK